MDKDSKTIDIKLPTRWEDLYNSLSLGKKKTRFSFCSRLLAYLTQKQLRYLFTLIAQGHSIDEVKAFFEVGLSQTFLEYGLWQDYGTGKETPRGNSGDIGRAKRRQRRKWFSTNTMRQ